MDQIIMIAKFNLLINSSNSSEVENDIASLDVSNILNQTTFNALETGKNSLKTIMTGYKPSSDNR